MRVVVAVVEMCGYDDAYGAGCEIIDWAQSIEEEEEVIISRHSHSNTLGLPHNRTFIEYD